MKFNRDSKYVFSYKKYVQATDDEKARWAKLAESKEVYVMSENDGIVFVNLDGALTDFNVSANWCKELEDFKKVSKESQYKFVKQEKYTRCKLNQILDFLVSRKYDICTEIYSKEKIEIRLYSLKENLHAKVEEREGIYIVDYFEEISEF